MLYAIVGVLVIILDQWSKLWIQPQVEYNTVGREIIPGILSLANVHNDGAAFGFLSGGGARVPFIILAGVFALVVIIALATNLISGRLARWCIVLVTAGGISNCIDRVIYGYVQDMFQFDFINFPVFNVADVFITVFAVLFALAVLFGKTRKEEQETLEEFEEDEEEEPRISRRKQKKNQRRAQREEEYEDEDEEEEEPVPVVQKPKKEKRAVRPAAVEKAQDEEKPKAAEVKPAAKTAEDPFAGWDRANAKANAEKKAVSDAVKAASKPAQTAPAKPAPKPAPKPAAPAEEEFSLDDILNEFR